MAAYHLVRVHLCGMQFPNNFVLTSSYAAGEWKFRVRANCLTTGSYSLGFFPVRTVFKIAAAGPLNFSWKITSPLAELFIIFVNTFHFYTNLDHLSQIERQGVPLCKVFQERFKVDNFLSSPSESSCHISPGVPSFLL